MKLQIKICCIAVYMLAINLTQAKDAIPSASDQALMHSVVFKFNYLMLSPDSPFVSPSGDLVSRRKFLRSIEADIKLLSTSDAGAIYTIKSRELLSFVAKLFDATEANKEKGDVIYKELGFDLATITPDLVVVELRKKILGLAKISKAPQWVYERGSGSD